MTSLAFLAPAAPWSAVVAPPAELGAPSVRGPPLSGAFRSSGGATVDASLLLAGAGAAGIAAAAATQRSVGARGRRSAVARRAAGAGFSAQPLAVKRATKTQTTAILETALLNEFKDTEAPDIFKIRDTLTRLAKLTRTPNQAVSGNWIILWASREGCVDKTFASGATIDNTWLRLQEYVLRLSRRKEGRVAEAYEILRKVGPFPNQSNNMKGKYTTNGTNGLQITFTEFKTDDGNEVKTVNDVLVEKKVVDLDVIYSSKNILAMQSTEAETGECDFFVLTPVDSIENECARQKGEERRRFFFN